MSSIGRVDVMYPDDKPRWRYHHRPWSIIHHNKRRFYSMATTTRANPHNSWIDFDHVDDDDTSSDLVIGETLQNVSAVYFKSMAGNRSMIYLGSYVRAFRELIHE